MGGGGHARVIEAMIKRQNPEVAVFFVVPSIQDCESASKPEQVITEEHFLTQQQKKASPAAVVLGIGENSTRRQLVVKFKQENFVFPEIIDPSCIIADDVIIGQGSVIMPGCVINSGAMIKDFCVVNTGSIIEHGCRLENFAATGPGAVICGDCEVGEGAYIGANATLIHGRQIGAWGLIGAGAVVTEDTKAEAVYVGVPAKFLKNKPASEKIL